MLVLTSPLPRSEPAPKPAQTPVDQPAPRATTTAPRTTTVPRTTALRTTTAPPPPMSAEQRARALFKKHGLDINPGEWNFSKAPQGERVQKDIRMRVHRTCHKCETSYGPDRTCTKCGHKRCKKCPRHPVKKEKKEKKPGDVTDAPGYKKRKGDVVYGLTIPSRRNGQPLVHKAIRQRVHRKCHRCEKDFAGEKVCNNCKHTRCKRCPREPYVFIIIQGLPLVVFSNVGTPGPRAATLRNITRATIQTTANLKCLFVPVAPTSDRGGVSTGLVKSALRHL
jgi:hypothetical protein